MRLRVVPMHTFVVETPLPPAEVLERLRGAVEAPVWRRGRLARPTLRRPFVGAVTGDAFDVERASAQRNAFLPVVEGRVEPAAGGTRVSGRIHLRYAGMAFLAVWLGGLLVGLLVLARRSLAAGRFDPLMLAPVGMLIAGVALTVAGYGPEARRALDTLAKVVRATRAELG